MVGDWICPRCKVDCSEKFHVTGSEINQYGACKLIVLCDSCFQANLTEVERQIYFKRTAVLK